MVVFKCSSFYWYKELDVEESSYSTSNGSCFIVLYVVKFFWLRHGNKKRLFKWNKKTKELCVCVCQCYDWLMDSLKWSTCYFLFIPSFQQEETTLRNLITSGDK